LFDLDKQMEKILTSNLPAHKKTKLYNEALQKLRLYEKKKRPEKPQRRKIAYRVDPFKRLQETNPCQNSFKGGA